MSNFVLSISGAVSREDAFSFFINQVFQEYGPEVSELVAARGFRRVLMCEPALPVHISARLKHMHLHSPNEFVWMGYDGIVGVDGSIPSLSHATYVLYGILPIQKSPIQKSKTSDHAEET